MRVCVRACERVHNRARARERACVRACHSFLHPLRRSSHLLTTAASRPHGIAQWHCVACKMQRGPIDRDSAGQSLQWKRRAGAVSSGLSRLFLPFWIVAFRCRALPHVRVRDRCFGDCAFLLRSVPDRRTRASHSRGCSGSVHGACLRSLAHSCQPQCAVRVPPRAIAWQSSVCVGTSSTERRSVRSVQGIRTSSSKSMKRRRKLPPPRCRYLSACVRISCAYRGGTHIGTVVSRPCATSWGRRGVVSHCSSCTVSSRACVPIAHVPHRFVPVAAAVAW